MSLFKTDDSPRFSNKSHLSAHLNYLFRTDKDQKWTNEYTDNNILFTFTEEGKVDHDLLDSPEKRKELRDMFYEYLSEIPLDQLRMVRMECTDDSDYFDDEMFKDMFKTMMNMHQVFPVLLFVIHVDQPDNYCHYHAIIYVR